MISRDMLPLTPAKIPRPRLGDLVAVSAWSYDDKGRARQRYTRYLTVIALYDHFALCITESGFKECLSYWEILKG